MHSGKHTYHVPQHSRKSEFMCLLYYSQKTAIFIFKRFNTLVFVIEIACVYCEVGTVSFYDKQINVRLYIFKLYFKIDERHFTPL